MSITTVQAYLEHRAECGDEEAKALLPRLPQASRVNREEAAAMVRAGQTYEDVSKHFGVSRERVRQIMKKAGVPSPRRHGVVAERTPSVVKMIEGGASDAEIIQTTGIPLYALSRLRARMGKTAFQLRLAERRRELAPAIEAVRNGRSIYSVAKEYGISQQNLLYECGRVGVRSTARSRWSDLSHRPKLIKRMRQKRMTWDEIAEELTSVERRGVTTAAIHQWAKRNCPEALNLRRRNKPRKAA